MENFILFTLTSLLVVITPGPGNILAIGRGLSQGKKDAVISSIASGCGILLHVFFATLGLTTILLASSIAFTIVKIAGALYLIYLGIMAIRSQSFISFENKEKSSMKNIIFSGFLTASLSPKIGIFILAFIPQFISHNSTNVSFEMALLGAWFAFLTTLVFSLMGIFSIQLKSWLLARPKAVKHINNGAGAALIGSGISLALAKQ
jgi:threonine/homoserine/homoserine lactone efflux protein